MRLSRTAIILIGVVGVLAIAVTYLVLNPTLAKKLTDMTRSTETVTDTARVGEMAIAYAAPPFVDDYGLMRISGYVQNLSASELRTAKVSIQLFDEDGNKKELIEHTVTDIDPGERKPYDANAGSITGSREATIAIDSLEVYK